MRISTALTLSLFLSFYASLVRAQSGDFLITHQAPHIKNVDNFNFEMIHDRNGLLCVANRNGVLKFDGQVWDFIRTPSAVFSLAVDKENTLYLGCRDGFGKITNDGAGKESYHSLSDGLDNSNEVFQVEEHEGSVYFLNEESLFRYSVASQKIEEQWASGESGAFNLAF